MVAAYLSGQILHSTLATLSYTQATHSCQTRHNLQFLVMVSNHICSVPFLNYNVPSIFFFFFFAVKMSYP